MSRSVRSSRAAISLSARRTRYSFAIRRASRSHQEGPAARGGCLSGAEHPISRLDMVRSSGRPGGPSPFCPGGYGRLVAGVSRSPARPVSIVAAGRDGGGLAADRSGRFGATGTAAVGVFYARQARRTEGGQPLAPQPLALLVRQHRPVGLRLVVKLPGGGVALAAVGHGELLGIAHRGLRPLKPGACQAPI